jgi:hypothetical protein
LKEVKIAAVNERDFNSSPAEAESHLKSRETPADNRNPMCH